MHGKSRVLLLTQGQRHIFHDAKLVRALRCPSPPAQGGSVLLAAQSTPTPNSQPTLFHSNEPHYFLFFESPVSVVSPTLEPSNVLLSLSRPLSRKANQLPLYRGNLFCSSPYRRTRVFRNSPFVLEDSHPPCGREEERYRPARTAQAASV